MDEISVCHIQDCVYKIRLAWSAYSVSWFLFLFLSACRHLLSFTIVSLPFRTVLLPYVGVIWKVSYSILLIWVAQIFIFAAHFGVQDIIQPVILYSLLACVVLLTFASFARLYELEYLNRVSYQVVFILIIRVTLTRNVSFLFVKVLCWHRFRAFFTTSLRNICWSDMRYPLKMILKQRIEMYSELTVAISRQVWWIYTVGVYHETW